MENSIKLINEPVDEVSEMGENNHIMDDDNSLKRKHEAKPENSESPSKLSRLENQFEEEQYHQNTQNKSECNGKDEEGSYESQSIINIIDKEVEETNENLMEECCLNEVNLKSEKDQIKRRRSSFGKYLTKPAVFCPSPEKTNKEAEDGTTSTEEALERCKVGADMEISPEASADQPDEQKSEPEVKDIIVSRKMKVYEDESKKLENEYQIWKKLLKSRKKRILEVKGELQEAKRGETVIEEEHILPHLNREQKTLLLSRPNYQEYLQKLKHSRESLILVNQEVEKATNIYQSFLQVSKMESQACFKIIERTSFPDVTESDPKVLLRSIMF